MGSTVEGNTLGYDGTLDEALEYVVKVLESDEALDREGLLSPSLNGPTISISSSITGWQWSSVLLR